MMPLTSHSPFPEVKPPPNWLGAAVGAGERRQAKRLQSSEGRWREDTGGQRGNRYYRGRAGRHAGQQPQTPARTIAQRLPIEPELASDGTVDLCDANPNVDLDGASTVRLSTTPPFSPT
jgi:hypothetical protein